MWFLDTIRFSLFGTSLCDSSFVIASLAHEVICKCAQIEVTFCIATVWSKKENTLSVRGHSSQMCVVQDH